VLETEATRVAAVEKEKKKIHDMPPGTGLEKKSPSKRKALDDTGKKKENPIEEKEFEIAQTKDKKPRIETSVQENEEDDALVTPQIELVRTYTPKAKTLEEMRDQA
jgi:hypothetical protein